MVKKIIEIDVDELKALGGLENLAKSLDKIDENQKQIGKTSEESLNKIEKGVKETEKATKSLSNGFKAVGLAIKAVGIGLVIEAFNILKDLFQSNQVIADKFGTAFKSLSIAFNDFFNYISDNAESVTNFFKAIFENPIESLKNFGNLIKENIIERFNSVLEVGGFVADALGKLFEGDFSGALDSIKEAGKEMVDVFTGVDDTVGKVGKLVDATIDYASSVWDSAAALQMQENNAKLAVAQQARLVEQYDRQAEKLRQVRDNDLNSIEERIKANDELGKVLDNQQKAMLAQADLQIVAAQNTLALNKSIENRVALIDALANREGVLAQIEGFRSEQDVNRNSLIKESIDLIKSRSQAENELLNNQKLFDAERLKDEEAKLEAQKKAIEFERENELERLQSNIDIYKQGTQARLDAEIEYNNKKQELDNAIIAKQDEIDAYRTQKAKEESDKRIANDEAEAEAKKNINNIAIQSAQGLVSILAGLGEKNKGIQRAALLANGALSIAEIINNTNVGSSKEVATKGVLGLGTSAVLYAKMAISIGSVIAATAKGLKGLGGGSVAGGGTAGGGGTAPTQTTAPTFNVVGNAGVNQVEQTLGNNQPVQAYVVAGNVTTAQSLNRNIINNATLG